MTLPPDPAKIAKALEVMNMRRDFLVCKHVNSTAERQFVSTMEPGASVWHLPLISLKQPRRIG